MEIKYRTELGKLLEHYGLKGDAIELGNAEGRHAEVLISQPAIEKLYLIDAHKQLAQIGDGSYATEWHENNWKEIHERVEPFKEKAVFLRGLTSEMIKQIPDDSLVLGYVDADHTFNGCFNDLVNLYPKIKKGGIIACHDYLNLSVQYGVNQAVTLFLLQNGYAQNELHLTEEDGDKSMVSCWWIKK